MPNFKHDDLFFDLEIRGNIFVNSQIYPEQKKIVVSFLEQLDDLTGEAPKKESVNQIVEDQLDKQADKHQNEFSNQFGVESQDNRRVVNAVAETEAEKLAKIETETPKPDDKPWKYGFLQKYYVKGPTDYQVVNRQDRLDKVTQRIKEVAKSVRDFKIEYENLAIPKQYLAFAKRYGISYDSTTYNQTKNKQALSEFKVVYDTDDDYNPDRDGLRIGYNSVNYDQTMIAYLLGTLTNPTQQTVSSKEEPKSLNPYFYQGTNNIIDNAIADKWIHNHKPTRHQEARINFIQAFYDRVINNTNKDELLSPSTLAQFNSTMFAEKNMSDALGNMFDSDKSVGLTTYQAWNASNRFVDVSAMNPKHISLKRCAMALGYKIQESATNREPTAPINDFNGIADLFAYNVNDIYVTWKLFETPEYYNRFTQNSQLLKEFPYLIYAQTDAGRFASDNSNQNKIVYEIGQDKVRKNRINVNATSTKFAINTIAPYKNTKIQDNPTLSLVYPDKKIAEDLAKQNQLPSLFHGHPRNALDYIEDLLNDLLDEDEVEVLNITDDTKQKIRDNYQQIRQFYEQYVGKNFNADIVETQDHILSGYQNELHSWNENTPQSTKANFAKRLYQDIIKVHPDDSDDKKQTIHHAISDYFIRTNNVDEQQKLLHLLTNPFFDKKNIPVQKLTIPYIRPDGTYVDDHQNGLSSYITLSIGGTHGIEIKEDNYRKDLKTYNDKIALFDKLINYYNQHHSVDYEVTEANLAQAIVDANADLTIKKLKETPLPFDENYHYIDIVQSSFSKAKPKLRKIKKPQLMKNDKIDDKYSYTSTGPSNHEDFDSYYPSLISQLAIFRNVDGNDVFTDDLYHPRLKMKALSKDKSLPEAERAKYKLRQLSMKLLVNSASGAGDMKYTNNAKCNNKMMAMRIIGQLFCWYIGQTLALFNARIPSTNTDGLYAMSIKNDLNDQLVEACAKRLILKLGPEHLQLFVSKDANNRLEANHDQIDEARGGALTSWQGPSTQNNVDHPAIVDYVLANYLAFKPDACNRKFDKPFAAQIFKNFIKTHDKLHPTNADTLRYFQFPLDASPNKGRYHYLSSLDKAHDITILNNTNRVFLVKRDYSNQTVKLTGLQVVQLNTVKTRMNTKDKQELMDIPFRNIIADYMDVDAEKVIKNNSSEAFYDQLLNTPYDPNAHLADDKPHDIKSMKIKNFPTDHPVSLFNEDLHDVDDEQFQEIINSLDLYAYLDMVIDSFNGQWSNIA